MANSILTTTVGSYPVPEWLSALPSDQARIDATRVVFDIQRQAGIDLATDGELYRFDINHPDTNGMIDYFIAPMGGVRTQLGRSDWERFARTQSMGFRRKPAGAVVSALSEGGLNLLADCEKAAAVAGGPFKFTVTSPYMLARTLVDDHYGSFEALLMAIAAVLAGQVADLPCACLQVDEANITGNPADADMAARSMNLVLERFKGRRAVHLCFGNYGGQTIQKGDWRSLVQFLNSLRVDHLVLELACRPDDDLEALKDVDLSIFPGEFVCIVGPSGCGKSTLLNILAGLLLPDRGAAFKDGNPITSAGPDRAVIFQDAALFPWLTTVQNVEFALKHVRTKRDRRQIAMEHLQTVHLGRFAGFYPHELSGGMRQRVAIARALALDPDSTEAAALVTALMVEPPTRVPPDLDASMAAAERVGNKDRSKRALFAFMSVFLFVPRRR